jgi:hypothetical protein
MVLVLPRVQPVVHRRAFFVDRMPLRHPGTIIREGCEWGLRRACMSNCVRGDQAGPERDLPLHL